MADSVHDGDKVSWNGPPSVPSGAAVEVMPMETEPVETNPVETNPAETNPVQTNPVETKHVETKHVETKPVETKPVETKFVEANSTESPLVVQNGEVGLEASDTAAPAAPASFVAPNSTIAPPAPSTVKVDNSGPTLGEHKAEDNPEKPQEIKENGAKNGEEGKATERVDEPQVGDKRKAEDEIPAVNTSNGATAKSVKLPENDTEVENNADGESDAKKQRTEMNGNGAKRGPGRPKGGAKTEKKVKVPTFGKAARKTRSQDKMA